MTDNGNHARVVMDHYDPPLGPVHLSLLTIGKEITTFSAQWGNFQCALSTGKNRSVTDNYLVIGIDLLRDSANSMSRWVSNCPGRIFETRELLVLGFFGEHKSTRANLCSIDAPRYIIKCMTFFP